MLSKPDTKQHDPHDLLEISPDVVLVARAAAGFPSLAPEAAGREAQTGSMDSETPRLDTTFRASDTSGERHSHGKWLRNAAVAFLLALVSGFGAAAWERYGDEAQAMLAGFAPQSKLASWAPTSLLRSFMPDKVTAQQDDAAAPADQAASLPAASRTVDSAARPAPAQATDTAQLIQSMARDVASLSQQLGELRARIAELKAGQEQMVRDLGKAQEAKAVEKGLEPKAQESRTPEVRTSEAKPVEPRPTKLGAPPRPLGTLTTPVHRSRPPAYPPAQAAYTTPPASAPVQIAPVPPPVSAQPDTESVVRPPMPVR